ncbi:MAG: hypothetical protein LPK38_04525 [Actinomycetes bacterium]|nr:hypothetical protein [Actinomycetes bacterium]MDX5380550.1 hypothetical protein [Actinomycetes bacterium]MDX5399439.1 hypothetical protein [Actinomycetes bacterium]MDX5450290.1 hypothetical protein [Actinomycetes bacterium]
MASDSLHAAINLRLALLDLPQAEDPEGAEAARLVSPLLARQRELSRRLSDRLPAVDQRIQTFLDDYCAGSDVLPKLPKRTLVLDQPGLARELTLPPDGDSHVSPLLSSYRLQNGVLHNPASDRRTTAGVFHVSEGGLPIPDDKLAVPREVFARMLQRAFEMPEELMRLPFTGNADEPASCIVSLLLRPLVAPAVPGYSTEKRMEIRFFVPGSLVANLDFVESIFGNGGDPYLPDNDAALCPDGWTGTTGLVVLAPQLTSVNKKEIGLPHWDDATERQRRDGMCWKDEDELYNGGQAFKLCARDERGVIVTMIADNYFGYCKKEVKTQISYSANLFGNVEEEHAGGALVFPSYNLGHEYVNDRHSTYTVDDVLARDPGRWALQPEGHALDTLNDHIVLVPQGATFSLRNQAITWEVDGEQRSIRLQAGTTYLGPNGYRVHMEPSGADKRQWQLVGTDPLAKACHKPSTVSGGGKSEISKAITDAFIYTNAYSADFDKDMEVVSAILARDYSNRFKDPARNGTDHRAILSEERSIGSVIKLLTPSEQDYTWEYNEWLRNIPQHVKELVYVVKRFYRPEWKGDWRSHFTVGIMNGRQGNAVRLDGERINVSALRVGFEKDGSWRIFSLRHDFSPAIKVQLEDDITASIVAPPGQGFPDGETSRKFVVNCERLLFQRPDDAIHRGYDKQTELDMSGPDNFLSNFEPLDADDAREMVSDAIGFSQFTAPMQNLIRRAAALEEGESPAYFVSSANPRLVDGKPSKNPRYLQLRPDLSNPKATASADVAVHLFKGVPLAQEVMWTIDVVAAGRRNNPPEPGVRPLCTFNPLHYMELPELFMEYISSMTGKSPSTTGAGSEGALTKGPFNAMPAIIDLNAALLSYVLTEYDGWVSCAGFVGPNVRVDHDISLLVPELFSRMTAEERDAHNLIADGELEKLEDFEHNGKKVLASRLGYRMNGHFAAKYFGRVFMHPHVVFTEEMLKPELQDVDVFVDSMDTIVTTHERVAKAYFADGTVEMACPPLRALLEIMAYGATSDGKDLSSPEVRDLFTRENVLASEWYAARLDAKQAADVRHADEAIAALTRFVETENNTSVVARLALDARLDRVKAEREQLASAEYRASLVGTLGLQPLR